MSRVLWDGANNLRGSMDASRYKDYMLGLMFYKFLSDQTLEAFKDASGETGTEEELVHKYEAAYEELGNEVITLIDGMLGYHVQPQYLYQKWLQDIREGSFELEKVTESLQAFERTVATTGEQNDFNEQEEEIEPILPLSEAKLVGSQKIDAHYIIQLIDDKATKKDGTQRVDIETLHLIYQHINELSHLGEYNQAELLKKFVQEEVEQGKVPSHMYIDDAFETWKKKKLRKEIYSLSKDWGFDDVIFEKAVESYSVSKPDDIPFRQDIVNSVDFEEAEKPQGKTKLFHNIELNKVLPNIVAKLKREFDS